MLCVCVCVCVYAGVHICVCMCVSVCECVYYVVFALCSHCRQLKVNTSFSVTTGFKMGSTVTVTTDGCLVECTKTILKIFTGVTHKCLTHPLYNINQDNSIRLRKYFLSLYPHNIVYVP